MTIAATESIATRAAALHEAADHLVAHPDLPEPYITSGTWGVDINYQLTIRAADNQRATMASIIRAVGGKWEKVDLDETFLMEQQVGLLRVRITAEREKVCARRVVGTETITIPAVEAQPERQEEREVVEWDCAPVLAEASA